MSRSRILHSYDDVTITGEGLYNFGLSSAFTFNLIFASQGFLIRTASRKAVRIKNPWLAKMLQPWNREPSATHAVTR